MKLGSEILWLSENDVASLLSIDDAITGVESAFRLYGEKKVQMPEKIYLEFEPSGDLRAMPAYLKGLVPAAGVKIVNSSPDNPKNNLPAVSGIMIMNDPATGLPTALLAAGKLTNLRTGAAGAIAAKYLARKDSSSVGLVGCGRQAQTQLEGLSKIFDLKKASVWGATKQESQNFCEKNKDNFSFLLESEENLERVCQSDIVVTTTPVRKPLVKASWIQAGTHINAIGADAAGKQELEMELLQKARVFVDQWGQASHSGEINMAVSSKVFTQEMCAGEIGDVVCGTSNGRTSPKDITIFDSTGLAIQDVSVAAALVEKAKKNNKGQVLKFHG